MSHVTPNIQLDMSEISFTFVRSPGPGGQNVNKLATAALLRFNIRTSTAFSETVRMRLLQVLAHRLTQDGELIIKASRFRTQEMNRQDALERLYALIYKAAAPPKPRKKTKPTKSSVEKRLQKKKFAGKRKLMRGKVTTE